MAFLALRPPRRASSMTKWVLHVVVVVHAGSASCNGKVPDGSVANVSNKV